MKEKEELPINVKTKLKLAAQEMFAAHGFEAISIRDICQRAGANVASVNYHFGGKQGLYEHVLKEAFREAFVHYPLVQPSAKDSIPERLERFVLNFLRSICEVGPKTYHAKLISFEMLRPTSALDLILAAEARPLITVSREIVEDALGKGAGEEDIWLCWLSVVSQIVFHHHCRPLVERIIPGIQYAESDLQKLARHITEFCLAGIESRRRNLKIHSPARKGR